MINHIGFPGLGMDFEISRVAFSLFGRPIYWYAIIIASGFFLAVLYGLRRKSEFGLKEDDITGMLILAVPLAIVVARLYYVIFNFELYRDDPISILYVWEGGIAIYGAIIGAIIGATVYCGMKRIHLLAILDIGALGLLIGQAIGRWGNFVNAEAYGGETMLPWRMEIFDSALKKSICVHPTFLYESLWNIVGFVILHFYSKKRKFEGEIFWMYVAWYGVGRAFIESMRSDSLHLFGTGIRTSQALAVITAIFAIAYLIYRYRKIKNAEVKNECSNN